MNNNHTKFFLIVLFLCIINNLLISKTIKVGDGGDYSTLSQAANHTNPGDTLLLQGILSGGDYISNLQGNANNWIYIISDDQNPALFSGGNTAFQLSDAAYLHIKGLSFQGQTQNGVNIDDGGSYETPSHHILIENCIWFNMNATGNNDELKLSGIDTFWIVGCSFNNGSAGGSLIDMVGCHNGFITNNTFNRGGSNCIQAKGGTRYITIERNWFNDGGQRSINIGGSTGLQYFRPIDANYEAADIFVYSNLFLGSVAPIAFVGSVNCKVINNTLVNPSRWLVRILQENTSQGFLTCANNTFANNICYFNNNANNELGINIGPNTAPETFVFSNNLWFNTDNQNWNGPNKNLNHLNTIVNKDPLFRDRFEGDYNLLAQSPAIGTGMNFEKPEIDFEGRTFNNPRAIGAYEYYSDNALEEVFSSKTNLLKAFYDRNSSKLLGTIILEDDDYLIFQLYSINGEKIIETEPEFYQKGQPNFNIYIDYKLSPGVYYLRVLALQKCFQSIILVY